MNKRMRPNRRSIVNLNPSFLVATGVMGYLPQDFLSPRVIIGHAVAYAVD